MKPNEHSLLGEASRRGLDDLYRHFWEGSETQGHFKDYCMVVLWEVTMALLAMDTEYAASGDEHIRNRLRAEWTFLQQLIPEEEMTGPHTACNPACDDAAWSAMCLMMQYRQLQDEHALELAARSVRRSYDFWKDGTLENGMWYRFGEDMTPREYKWTKSVYCAGLLLTALEYHRITKDTPRADPVLFEDTMALYRWVEAHLRRDGKKTFRGFTDETDDKLYYCDFVDNRDTGAFWPAGSENPGYIYEAGSCCCLFGATAMASIHALLYDMTGEEVYLNKAVETANALVVTAYNHDGILLNDRDAWTNTAFMGYFVRLVLGLPGIDPELPKLINNTALSIINQRTPEGFYPPEWGGGCRWTGWEFAHTKINQLNTNGTSYHMIAAAHLAETLGYI